MAGRIRWAPDAQRRLIELHAQGKTMKVVAEEMGYSTATIQRRARDAGLVWGGAGRIGPAVRKEQLAEEREDLATRLERLAHQMADRVEAEWSGPSVDLIKGEYGAESEVTLSRMPARSAQPIAAAIKALSSSVTELRKLQAAHANDSAADAWMKWMLTGQLDISVTTGNMSTGDDENASISDGEL